VTTTELLLLAARAGVTFWLDGDRLAYRAPAGRMTGDLRDEVIAHKAELIAMLRRNRLDAAFPVPTASSARDGGSPLASGQERLWLIERRLGRSPLYNIHFRLRWRGRLDHQALELSLRDVVARHPAMRTTFTESDGVPRAITAEAIDMELARSDLRGRPPDDGTAERLIDEHQREPFDFEAGPLLRATVLTLAEDDHIVLVTQHHIITDGWSLRIFLAELARGYRDHLLGEHQAIPGPVLSFADYVRWEGQWRAGPGYQERLAWWKEHLTDLEPLALHRSGSVPGTEPPGFGPPGAVPAGYRGAVHEFRVTAGLAGRLRDLAAARQCTLFTVLLTGWAILLYRHVGQSRFAVGTVTSGREQMEFQPLLGFFANTVVLLCDLSGNPSVTTAISRVQAETEAVFAREIPFADIVRTAGPVPDTGLSRLIQAAFMFPKLPAARFGEPGDAARVGAEVTVEARIDGSVEGTAKFDLSLTMEETEDGIGASIEYATALFDADMIRRIEQHLLVLLENMAQNPAQPVGRLRLMTQDEQRRLLEEWSNPGRPGALTTKSSVERRAPSLLAV
jgi:hypothetical protein